MKILSCLVNTIKMVDFSMGYVSVQCTGVHFIIGGGMQRIYNGALFRVQLLVRVMTRFNDFVGENLPKKDQLI